MTPPPTAEFVRASPDGYRVEPVAGWPPAATAALEQLAAACQFWPQPGVDRFPDAFAAWPGVGGVVVARVRDDGRDDENRPHTARLSAAWLAGEPTTPEVVRWLEPGAWGEDGPPADPPLAPEVDAFRAAHRRCPRVLVSPHGGLAGDRFDLGRPGPGGRTSRRPAAFVPGHEPPISAGPNVATAPRRSSFANVLTVGGSFAIGLAVGAVAVGGYWLGVDRPGAEERRRADALLLSDEARKSEKLETDLISAKTLREVAERAQFGLQQELEQERRRIDQLKNQHKDAALISEVSELEKKVVAATRTLEEVKQRVGDINKRLTARPRVAGTPGK